MNILRITVFVIMAAVGFATAAWAAWWLISHGARPTRFGVPAWLLLCIGAGLTVLGIVLGLRVLGGHWEIINKVG